MTKQLTIIATCAFVYLMLTKYVSVVIACLIVGLLFWALKTAAILTAFPNIDGPIE